MSKRYVVERRYNRPGSTVLLWEFDSEDEATSYAMQTSIDGTEFAIVVYDRDSKQDLLVIGDGYLAGVDSAAVARQYDTAPVTEAWRIVLDKYIADRQAEADTVKRMNARRVDRASDHLKYQEVVNLLEQIKRDIEAQQRAMRDEAQNDTSANISIELKGESDV